MTDFSNLFQDDSRVAVPGADTFNEPINWDTGMRSNEEKVLSHPDPHWIWTMFRVCYIYVQDVLWCCRLQSTTSIQYFQGYRCESILVFSSLTAMRKMRDQILISYFLTKLLSDGINVRICNCLQSGPVSFWRQLANLLCVEHVLQFWMQWHKWPDRSSWTVVCR